MLYHLHISNHIFLKKRSFQTTQRLFMNYYYFPTAFIGIISRLLLVPTHNSSRTTKSLNGAAR
jgi:hypothetical protein